MSKDILGINDDSEKPTNIVPSQPQSKVKNMLEEIELLTLHKERGSGIDISSFNESQKDKLLDILAKNEENAFSYHSKRLETVKDIEIKRLDTSIVNQKTLRIIVIGGIIAIPIVTILIMFYKDTYFVPWLTFLAGLAGGTGISKLSKYILKTPEKTNLEEE